MAELACCWQRAVKRRLLKSNASLTGSFFSSWSLARQFSPSSLSTLLKITYLEPKVPAIEIVFLAYDWNSHVSAAASVFGDACARHSFSTHNMEGERILKFAIANGLCVGKQQLVQEERFAFNYIQLQWLLNPSRLQLYWKSFSNAVSNVEIILHEECVRQYLMVVCEFPTHIPVWRNASSHLTSAPRSYGTRQLWASSSRPSM